MYKLLSLLFLCLPSICFGSVLIGDYTLTKGEAWNKSEYNITGSVVIPKGITLKINSQNLYLESGSIYVYGNLEIIGDGTVTVGNSFNGVFVINGSVLISDKNISGCPKIMIWEKGTGIFSRDLFTSCASSGVMISSWKESNVSITDSNFNHNTSTTIIESYGSTSLSIENSQFTHNQVGRMIQVYGSGSVLQVRGTEFRDASGSVGVEVFNASTAYIDTSVFSGIRSGIQTYGGSELVVSGNSFLDNTTGIEMYDASTTISENSFEKHLEYAVFASGGVVDARNNWWADMSGPKYVLKNLTGKGESLDGLMDVYPWLIEKPNIQKCCSSVVFIPGIQGSRLYTRGYAFENQLWEPNRDADVKKLFFDSFGKSISKAIYIRDIIDRTNVGSSIGIGSLDVNIYKDFVDFVSSLKKKGSIKNYEVLPYDWRYSSSEVLEMNKEIWKKKIIEIAKQSKTNKVVLVGHSFGGIIATKFAEYLNSQGVGDVVDDIVIVGTPEQGSFSVIRALLHGDGQSLGNSYLLSEVTARNLSKNITSTYDLLQKTMSSRLFNNAIAFYPQDGKKIFNSTSPVDSVEKIKDFIFKQGVFVNRSIPNSESDISTPMIGNVLVYDKVKTGVETKVSDSVASKIFNILGTNELTPIGIEYRHICSNNYGLFFVLGLKTLSKLILDDHCSVERKTKFTNEGDGIVPLGDTTVRLGKKIYIDFKKYMNLHEYKISHANLMSSEPVLSILKEILFKRKLTFASAAYITLPESELQTDTVSKYWRVRVLGKGNMHIETDEGVLDDTAVKEGYSETNKIVGSSYEVIQGNRYVLLPVKPNKIEIKSNDFGYSNITVDSVEGNNSVYTASPNQLVYFYPTMPVSPGSVVTAEQKLDAPYMRVDFNGDSVIDEEYVSNIATTTQSEFAKKYTMEEIIIELVKLKELITQSPIRQKFKDRYLLKVDALLRKIKQYDTLHPKKYSLIIYTSLESIINEVQTGYRNYKGGLRIDEASVLYVGFGKVYLMFMNLKE